MSDYPWVERLLAWYREHQRELPWRSDPTPYRVWISEIMLQQTQVETVKPYFARFLQAFPDIETLATADEQEVLRLWQGLGYYSRARRLHAAAKLLVSDHGSRLPDTYDALLQIPGFGTYTAAAVASIAFGEHVPVVDGNVLRVWARFTGSADDVTKQKTKRAIFAELQPPIAAAPPSDFNQAMMELGATVCRPQNPTCLLCPLQDTCAALRDGRVDELPVKTKRKATPHHELAVALIRRDTAVLLVQRPADAMLGGLWELPGGRRKPKESAPAALTRILRDTYGSEVTAGAPIGEIQHAYSHFSITVSICPTELHGSPPQGAIWAPPNQLGTYPMHKAALKALALAGVTKDA